jgi:glucuronokinase
MGQLGPASPGVEDADASRARTGFPPHGLLCTLIRMMITAHAHARAGLVGNPSDGYFGKTLSFIVRNFHVTVKIWESPTFEILPSHGDLAKYDSVEAYLKDQKLFGYYGGMRLLKATVKRFYEFAKKRNHPLNPANFTLGFESNIPRLVGLSGSSGIIIATIRALAKFHNMTIANHELPGLALSVERDELGITAGLQDRVIQTYEGMVYMDFEKSLIESRGYGVYEPLTPNPMPPLYVAYDPSRAEISDVPHRNLRELWTKGDPTVVNAMQELRDLTDAAKKALLLADFKELGRIVDMNYGVRQKIMNIAPENHRMVEVARSVGCSSHFCGSGGAVCGLYTDGDQYQSLVDAMGEINCTVIRPVVFG